MTKPVVVGYHRKIYIAHVDDSDYELVSRYSWSILLGAGDIKYAISTNRIIERKKHNVLMHRLILDAPVGVDVDHKNGNGLDNRRKNLRLATRSQNNMNRMAYTGYKGVSWHESSRKWIVQIQKDGKIHYLGLFLTAEEGAIAYNKAAVQLFGEFAHLNDVELGLAK